MTCPPPGRRPPQQCRSPKADNTQKLTTERNRNAWSENFNVVALDHPVGVGLWRVLPATSSCTLSGGRCTVSGGSVTDLPPSTLGRKAATGGAAASRQGRLVALFGSVHGVQSPERVGRQTTRRGCFCRQGSLPAPSTPRSALPPNAP
ncbi:hypothetical protein PHLGIDRAFT_123046 [Phlebiopsis gigantea 11061_1 CR5-6]|uniref:Uncharacterized protein n=1 Tax=Phlebiopsis gigantea (strain 11061_1 CR5-6) TaxID=745531 RepID=A0A0C3NBB8_PHLG1|nr:hypothetical protein PHLGIDRAFT_123046 [Phlebiopsis gigantea 11061_1 CR5-6]